MEKHELFRLLLKVSAKYVFFKDEVKSTLCLSLHEHDERSLFSFLNLLSPHFSRSTFTEIKNPPGNRVHDSDPVSSECTHIWKQNDSLCILSVWNASNLCEIDCVWIGLSNLGTSNDFDRLNNETLRTQLSFAIQLSGYALKPHWHVSTTLQCNMPGP